MNSGCVWVAFRVHLGGFTSLRCVGRLVSDQTLFSPVFIFLYFDIFGISIYIWYFDIYLVFRYIWHFFCRSCKTLNSRLLKYLHILSKHTLRVWCSGKLSLKEPTYLSYVWKEYYFILDKQGKLSQMDTDCAGMLCHIY